MVAEPLSHLQAAAAVMAMDGDLVVAKLVEFADAPGQFAHGEQSRAEDIHGGMLVRLAAIDEDEVVLLAQLVGHASAVDFEWKVVHGEVLSSFTAQRGEGCGRAVVSKPNETGCPETFSGQPVMISEFVTVNYSGTVAGSLPALVHN